MCTRVTFNNHPAVYFSCLINATKCSSSQAYTLTKLNDYTFSHYSVHFSPADGVSGSMFGLPGPPGPPGPPGHKGEPGTPGTREWSLDSGDYSSMAVKVTDYIKCKRH